MLSPQKVLVGRDQELALLSGMLPGGAEGSARLVVLAGPAGVGKTALVAAVTDGFDGRVLRAQAASWETGCTAGVLRQLLQSSVPADPMAAAELLVQTVGSEPALAVVDDADAADEVSLQALSTAVRHHHNLPLTVLLVVRQRDRVNRLGGSEVRLGGLDEDDLTELATAYGLVLHPVMATALRRHTGGMPAAVVALLEELPATAWARFDSALPAPAQVAREIGDRLDTCSPQTRSLVEAVAILGDGVELTEVAMLAGLDDPLPALDAACEMGLLAPGPATPDPMIRAAVLAHLGAHAAAALHRRAADIARDPTRRLMHRVEATPTTDPSLAEDVEQQARSCADGGAWATAARLWRASARLTPNGLLREERLTHAVDAQVASGDVVGATARVPEMDSLRETPLRDAVLAYLAIVRGRAIEADQRLQRAWAIVNVDRDPRTAGLIAQRYVLDALARCQGMELVAWADRAIGLAGSNSPAGLEAAAIRGLGVAAAGDPDGALAAYAELAGRVPHGAQTQRVAMGMGWLQLIVDDLDGARVRLESASVTEHLGGSVRIALWSAAWLARVQVLLGDWDQAMQTVEHGREMVRSSGITLIAPLLEWTAAQVHALRGEWEPAEEAVRLAESAGTGYAIMEVPARLARAQVAEARSDYVGVIQALEPLTRSATDARVTEPALWPWIDVLANALVVEGRYDDADALLCTQEKRIGESGHRSTRARLGYARGRLLGARGDLTAARASFDESLRLLETLPLRYDRARVRFAYGQTLRRARKRREADRVLSLARDAYLSLGAQTYVERCDRELRAGGVDVPQGGRAPDTLTPQEESVASLVSTGLSNREVGARLFVSPKTVQYHLTRIYAKLGVSTRVELATLHHPEDSGE